MILDCAVIGGGPAGLNASLVLGRARRKIILFDDNRPRNAVTSESHGFITRDGIDPQELKRIAQDELRKYPDVRVEKQRVREIQKKEQHFQITMENGDIYQAKKVILATGFKEIMPDVKRVAEFYGNSLFSCPYCDGWELRDQPLAVISENPHAFHMAKIVSNWTDDVIVCTNGRQILSEDEKEILGRKHIHVYEEKILSLIGECGALEEIAFVDGTTVKRTGGFITPEWTQSSPFASALGCARNERGGIDVDQMKQTTIPGVFACGDTLMAGPSQLIIAAGEGSMAGAAVNAALVEESFAEHKKGGKIDAS
ncbi:thioredoxin reductase [Sinobaca qinghaiensis]|uniref:Thioredoxin reductase n=1 Tax=Sinobaca qinghaiensis TaxID=342944 RepID=A0A419V7R5_9BACL|nr:NAD(P)/FAD-dependent oxidoreductase [Sinobaca qinghaiensis]RKD75993.1 thioredoxin reductase [Sinobaca qinghaiensis]